MSERTVVVGGGLHGDGAHAYSLRVYAMGDIHVLWQSVCIDSRRAREYCLVERCARDQPETF